jgi:hypothetical protein
MYIYIEREKRTLLMYLIFLIITMKAPNKLVHGAIQVTGESCGWLWDHATYNMIIEPIFSMKTTCNAAMEILWLRLLCMFAD